MLQNCDDVLVDPIYRSGTKMSSVLNPTGSSEAQGEDFGNGFPGVPLQAPYAGQPDRIFSDGRDIGCRDVQVIQGNRAAGPDEPLFQHVDGRGGAPRNSAAVEIEYPFSQLDDFSVVLTGAPSQPTRNDRRKAGAVGGIIQGAERVFDHVYGHSHSTQAGARKAVQ